MMIRRATVLVLGAGASRAYGLSTAREIVDDLSKERFAFGPLAEQLRKCGFPDDEISFFLNKLGDSGQYSIDAFVQRFAPPPDVRRIAKAAMAARLLWQEDHDSLTNVAENADWYRVLFAGMFPAKADDFVGNHLRVITLNFDRSFERRLYLMLESTYNIRDAATLVRLTTSVPVLHLHGDLGAPAWLVKESETWTRQYRRDVDPSRILECANRIRVVDDEINPEQHAIALEWLAGAERVIFVGFSFHEDNMRRLCCERLGNQAIFGTAKGLPPAAQERAYRVFNSPRKGYLFDCTARELLDRVDLFN